MKKLYEVTLEDALSIIFAAESYKGLSVNRNGSKSVWELTDESEDIGEPCKRLQSGKKVVIFWFNETDISIAHEDMNVLLDDWYDIKLACYIKAVELGYYVPILSEFINK